MGISERLHPPASALYMGSRIKFPIAAKFGVMLVVLVAALFAVGVSGVRGLANLNDHVKGLYGDNIVTLQRTAVLAADVNRAEKVALQVVVAADTREITRLEDELERTIVPRVSGELAALRAIHAPSSRKSKRSRAAGNAFSRCSTVARSATLPPVHRQHGTTKRSRAPFARHSIHSPRPRRS
jgi:Four helix bundle sensory module for signal transduction